MINLLHPEQANSIIINKLNSLIEKGYLVHDFTKKRRAVTEHQYKTKPNINLLLDGHYFDQFWVGEILNDETCYALSTSKDDCVHLAETDKIQVVDFRFKSLYKNYKETDDFQEATQLCSQLTSGGKTDWRFPTLEECKTHFYFEGCSYLIDDTMYEDDTEYYWTDQGTIFSNFGKSIVNNVTEAFAIAVRNELLDTID